jgi:DNA ligase-1
MATFKPMLASNVELESVIYPVYVTPKYDGIRCVIRGGQALSRQLKPIPNRHVQKMLKGCPDNLDGELICHGKTFNQIQSEIMREDGDPEFSFYVFDIIDTKAPYLDRMEKLEDMELPAVCNKVIPSEINNEEELLEAEREAVEEFDFEGLMIRTGDGPYKYGRSTSKQGYLCKLKRFTDAEAVIIGYDELMHNNNEQTIDALGYAKRSHKKEGMVPAGTLGAFIVRDGEKTFKVATGMTAADRQEYWNNREEMIGKVVKYKYQESGAKDLPRFPTFLGIRHPDDL